MIRVDVKVLLDAHREDSQRHAACRAWLAKALEGREPCVVSEPVLSGCLRLPTHPRIFDPPTPLAHAVGYVSWIRRHPRMTVLAAGPRHGAIFLSLCQAADARGNFVRDAYHAALAIETGSVWITTDRDCARFPGLKFRHLPETPTA